MDAFRLTIADWRICEIPDCGQHGVDIHHIKSRGMGGSKKLDVIENLMAVCRDHHNEYGDITEHREYLKKVHFDFMDKNGVKHEPY